jgi:hypothetical protein
LNKSPRSLLTNTKPKTTAVHSPKPRFEISSVIDEFQGMNQNLIVNDGYKGIVGTSNPYQFNLFSDLITNPSSVSISEFQKMVYTQPVIKVGLTILMNLIKNQIGKYTHKNKKIQDFINEMIDNMKRSFADEIISDIFTGVWAGFSICEKRYDTDGRYVVVKDLEPRPAQSIIYRVDSQGHLKDDGIIQYYFNNLWTGYGNLLAFNQIAPNGLQTPNPYASKGDFDYPWRTVWAQPIGTVVIPKDKCVHFVYKGLDGLTSPYGRSLLRDIYDYYVAKSELNRITRNAANANSSPIPFVTIDPNQANQVQPNGQTVMNAVGDALDNLNTPGGANYVLMQGKMNESVWINTLNTAVNVDHYVNLNKYYDSMMLTGVLLPSELAGLSDKGSYALGQTQQDLLGRNVDSIANQIKSCLIQQLIKPLLQTNFNEHQNFGAFAKNDNVAEDIALNLDKINSLRFEGIKLKPESIMEMLDLPMDYVESINNPIMDTISPDVNNKGINANMTRVRNF